MLRSRRPSLSKALAGYPVDVKCLTPKTISAALLVTVLSLGFGCTSPDLLKAQAAYRMGDLERARSRIEQLATSDDLGGNTAILAYLEMGAIAFDQGDFAASEESFANAQAGFALHDARPDVSLSRETLAVISNLNALPYRGTGSDRILAATYRALHNLLTGQPDRARVELRRAYERQRQAVDANAKRIAEARDELSDQSASSDSQNARQTLDDPSLGQTLQRVYSPLDQYAAYGDYVNPFTEWLQGVYHRAVAVAGNDLEWSRKSFERLAGMLPDNADVQEDYRQAELIAAGGPIEPTTYVIFATGTAPALAEIRIDIPLWIFSRQVDYFGASFPRLQPNPSFLPMLSAELDGQRADTRLLCDMDAVRAQELKNELPVIVTKTLLSAGAKAAAAYGLRRSVERQDQNLGVLVRLVGLIYQYASNQADLRAWASLPKQYQLARLPHRETSRQGWSAAKIDLLAPGRPRVEVPLDAARVNVVFVRCINASSPLLVHHFSLGPLE